MSVDPVYSRWCTEIEVGEKLIDVGWPCEQANKRHPYHGKLFRTRYGPKHKYKRIREDPGLGMFAQVIKEAHDKRSSDQKMSQIRIGVIDLK